MPSSSGPPVLDEPVMEKPVIDETVTERTASDRDRRPSGRLLVLADSLSFYDQTGGLAADDPRIWPNQLGAATGREVDLFARIGWTSRDIWWALTADPNIWAAVPKADAVIFAFGGMDSLPSPLPTALREDLRYVRPPQLRRTVRTAYQWLQPRLSPLGWPMALPPKLTVAYTERIRGALAALRPELPVLACLPPTHASPYYGYAHPGQARTSGALRHWAAQQQVATVDFYPVTRDAFADPACEMNPDGIHWGLDCHDRIAQVTATALAGVCTG